MIDKATLIEFLCVWERLTKVVGCCGRLVFLWRGAAGSARDIRHCSLWVWYTPEEGRRERFGGLEARSREARQLPRALWCKREGSFGRSCGRKWRTFFSGGTEVPAHLPTAKRSPLRYRRWSGLLACSAAKAFATCWRSGATPGLEGACPACKRRSEVPGMRCDAWECFGDCGVDLFCAWKIQVVQHKNEQGRQLVFFIFYFLKISDVRGRTIRFHELFDVEFVKRQHQATS